MGDRLQKFIETAQLFKSKLKLRVEEGYFVGFICKPVPEDQDEYSEEPCVTIEQAVLKSACSEDCHFPTPLTFKYSEVEELEILEYALSSDLPSSSKSLINPQSSHNGDKPQTNLTMKQADEVSDTNSSKKFSDEVSQSDSPKQLNGKCFQSHVRFKEAISTLNDSRDSSSNATNLSKEEHSSSNLSNVDVRNRTSNQNLEAVKANDSDPRLKDLSYYGEKFVYDQLKNGHSSCALPQTYFLVETRTFFKIALDIIKEESQIGCAFNGIDIGPHGTLCSIQISTKEYVFILDALNLLKSEDFISDLKSILENDQIKKVTFNCRKASQLLRRQFNTHLTNVYDVQIADVWIQRQNLKGDLPKNVRPLPVLLVSYLNLPTEHARFYNDRRIKTTDDRIWSKRPMPKPIVELAAFCVRYFLELKRKTTILMMAEFNFAVDMFINNDDHNQKDDTLPSEFSRFDYSSGRSNSNSSCSSRTSSPKQNKFPNFARKQENLQEKENNSRKERFNTSSPLADGENIKFSGDDSVSSISESNCLNEGVRRIDLNGECHKTNSHRFHEPQNRNNSSGNRNNFRGNGNNFRGNGNNFMGNRNNQETNKCEERNTDVKPKEVRMYPTGMTNFNNY